MSTHYKALTRTYRPQVFDDIVSQEHVSNTLKNAIDNNRIGHAYLFCGPRGVGKTTMARVLARTINQVGLDVDGEELNNTLNIIEIDAASNNSVDDIRSLRERVRIPPQSGRFKIYIIDEIHMLSKQAFNALLKTLEEPPAHVIFIFATTEPHRILPTILSRCQRFDFRRITVDEIVARLQFISEKESLSIDSESLHVIAKRADGALRDALGIMDQAIAFCGTTITAEALHRALNIVSSEALFELTEYINQKDARAGMAQLHHLLLIGNDIQEFLSALTGHLRNLYLSKDTQNLFLIEASRETKEQYQKQSDSFSEDDLLRMMYITHEAQFSIRNAQQPRTHLEITLLKLFHMTRTDGFEKLIRKLDTLDEKANHMGNVSSSATDNKASGEEGASGLPENPSSGAKKKEHPPQKREAPHTGTQKKHDNVDENRGKATEPGSEETSSVKDSEIFGTPTLRRPKAHLSAVPLSQKTGDHDEKGRIDGNLALIQEPTKEKEQKPSFSSQKKESSPKKVPARKASCLKEIDDIWPAYLKKLEQTFGTTVFFSLQKARPIELKKETLVLECNDTFIAEIINEQQKKLCKTLAEHFGYLLRLTTRLVEKQEKDREYDEFDRFTELQKKDPRLQLLAEKFGAEPEY